MPNCLRSAHVPVQLALVGMKIFISFVLVQKSCTSEVTLVNALQTIRRQEMLSFDIEIFLVESTELAPASTNYV